MAKTHPLHPSHPFRIFAISGALTIVLGLVMALYGGLTALWLFSVLALLEVTFSFDNAVVNSRVLAKLSPLWQKLFLTVGIFIAVFIVRFMLPIIIVTLTAGLGAADVVNLALNHPAEYGHKLHEAAPLIDAFGGTFLMMIGLNYFVDRQKEVHWLRRTERTLSRLGQIPFIKLGLMLVVAAVLYWTALPSLQTAVAIASLLGIALHVGLGFFSSLFEKNMSREKAGHLVGAAAFASFLYLEVLDASFSFDGVVGAFAITNSVLLIVAGLGAGALWVRSLTVYLMRAGTLAKYRYLEHGAHWAILALGAVMLIKLYRVEMPEWFTGSLGLIFIAIAVVSSVIEKRLEQKPSRLRGWLKYVGRR
jgi:uncharacterized protein